MVRLCCLSFRPLSLWSLGRTSNHNPFQAWGAVTTSVSQGSNDQTRENRTHHCCFNAVCRSITTGKCARTNLQWCKYAMNLYVSCSLLLWPKKSTKKNSLHWGRSVIFWHLHGLPFFTQLEPWRLSFAPCGSFFNWLRFGWEKNIPFFTTGMASVFYSFINNQNQVAGFCCVISHPGKWSW